MLRGGQKCGQAYQGEHYQTGCEGTSTHNCRQEQQAGQLDPSYIRRPIGAGVRRRSPGHLARDMPAECICEDESAGSSCPVS